MRQRNWLKSETHFPKRAQSFDSVKTIGSYTSQLFTDAGVEPQTVAPQMSYSNIPQWELSKANYDINYTDLRKSDGTMLPTYVKAHINENYINHLKIYTDGSLLENQLSGAAFIIPSLKIEKSYHIGKNFSVFTAELIAIIMALNYLLSFPYTIFQILF